MKRGAALEAEVKQGALEQLGGKVAEWRWAWRWTAWVAPARPSHLCHSACEPRETSTPVLPLGILRHWHLAGLCPVSFPPSQGGPEYFRRMKSDGLQDGCMLLMVLTELLISAHFKDRVGRAG